MKYITCMYGIGSWIEHDEFGKYLIWDMEWFIGKKWWILAWYWHEVKFYIHEFGKDELLLIQQGIWMRNGYEGGHEIYMCNKYYLIDWVWLVCGQCVIPWASRQDLMVVLQWLGCNSMTLVSENSWWCLIYIIW